MTMMVWTYAAYLVICIGVTIWVARILRHNGIIVLTDGTRQSQPLAQAVSHLVVVGFYLVNLGAICFFLKASVAAHDVQSAIELLSTKIGLVFVGLGIVHFTVIAIFATMRSVPHRDDSQIEVEMVR